MVSYFILFIVLILFPFLPGIIEYFKRKDDQPLEIKQDFTKNPAFFGESFNRILTQAILERSKKVSKDTLEIILSSGKPESLKIVKDTIGGEQIKEIIFAEGEEVETDKPLESYKEVVVRGNFTVKHPSLMRSLLVFGNLKVKDSLKVVRWIHVEGKAIIKAKSNLGINLYAKKIHISAPCSFKRIFAQEIVIGEDVKEDNLEDKAYYIKGTIRSKGALNIKTEDKKLVIEGNLISNEDIVAEGGVWIKGDVFSHGGVIFLRGVLVGQKGKIKSVIGKKKVKIGKNVKVYGYIHTEGEGIVDL
ncbi:MAG: hypothetical protein ACK4SU_00675 [Dictyoglomus sp.]